MRTLAIFGVVVVLGCSCCFVVGVVFRVNIHLRFIVKVATVYHQHLFLYTKSVQCGFMSIV